MQAVIGAVASVVSSERSRTVSCAPFDFVTHGNKLTSAQFKRLYRMNFNNVVTLRNKIALGCRRTKRSNMNISPAVTPDFMLSNTLPLLAGASYLHLSRAYGIGLSTVFSVSNGTLDVLCNLFNTIKFRIIEEAWEKEAKKLTNLRETLHCKEF